MKLLKIIIIGLIVFMSASLSWGKTFEQSGLILYPSTGTELLAMHTKAVARYAADGTTTHYKLIHTSGASTPYEVSSAVTFEDYESFEFEPRAMLSGGTVAIYSPANIKAGSTQQIFDGATVTFTESGGCVSPNMWGTNTTPGTTDMTDEINYALAASANIMLIDDEYLFTDITLVGDYNFLGTGFLVGSTTGSAPLASVLKATDSSGRLVLMEAYYNSVITLSSDIDMQGKLRINDALIKSSNKSFDVEGVLISDNISMHSTSLNIRLGGDAHITTYFSNCDSNNTALYCQGGMAEIENAIVVASGGRGGMCYNGGVLRISEAEIYDCSSDGLYVLYGGSIIADNAIVDGNGGNGAVINYGGSIQINGATINGNTGSGVVSESNGTIYAINSEITSNTLSGIFTTFGGFVNANGAIITGNGSYALDCRLNSSANIINAVIDLTNNSGDLQVRALQGGNIYSDEPGVDSGLTSLASDDFKPLWNQTDTAGSFIGEADPQEFTNRLGGLDLDEGSTARIDAGIVLITSSNQKIDTESSTATDDLDSIDTDSVPVFFFLKAASTTRTTVIKHGTGNIYTTTGSDISLDNTEKAALIYYVGTRYLAMPMF